MKKAIILVGAHHVGKSLTINQHLKPMLKISHDAHVFQLGGKTGFVLSQSAEEAERYFGIMPKRRINVRPACYEHDPIRPCCCTASSTLTEREGATEKFR